MTKHPLYPFLLLCFVSFYGSTVYAQASKSYNIVQAEPVFEPASSSFAVAGLQFVTLLDSSSIFISLFYDKIAVVRTSKSSNTPWAKILKFENRDVYSTFAATPDGGFLVNMGIARGVTETVNKFVLAKFNAQNVLQWVKTIQFDENATTSVNSFDFAVGDDGNILLTGNVQELNAPKAKFFYLFLNANGNRIRSFYLNEPHALASVCSRSGGGFAVMARIDTTVREQYRFMLFDVQGQLVSSKTYKGDPSFYSNSIGLKRKNDGGFVGISNGGLTDFDNTGTYLKSIFPLFGTTNFGYAINGPIYLRNDGSYILQGSFIDGTNSSVNPAFFVYNNAINVHYLRGEANSAFYVSANNNGGITLSTSSFRSNRLPTNPPLKVVEYAVNAAFDRTDCGVQISRASIASTTSDLTRTNLPDLVAVNANPIITTLINSSLQLINFNVSHSPLCQSVGVSETDLNGNIAISPNPSSGVFSIKLDNQNIDLQRLTVYNYLGQVVLDKKESNWEAPLSIEQSGTYIVKIQTNIGSILKKIVKVD